MFDLSTPEGLRKAQEWTAAQVAGTTETAPESNPLTFGVAQPDENGEFASPLDGALWMAHVHGKRQIPLNGKAAFLTNWQEQATTDPAQIKEWYEQFHCNFGSVADDGEIFEVDSPEVRKRFQGQFSKTLTVASSEGKGHRYYLPADVDHIAQNAVKHGDFSLRKHNAYCVSPGSVHPQTGNQYRVVVNAPMAKPTSDEIDFWNSERIEKKSLAADVVEPIPEGQRNSTIASILGKARQDVGAGYDVLLALARQHNERCHPSLPDSELQVIAHSIARYAVKPTGGLVFNPPAGPVRVQEQAVVEWRPQFKTVGELEQGNVRMLIAGFLPEGTTFIGGLPGEGKTLFALSIAKALTTGDPFLGKFFVEEPTPVIYLIPESSSRAFRARCETFRIPNDENLFLCRTVSEGATLALDDKILFEAIRHLKPVVILDTFIRFSESDDENDAAQNKKIVNDIVALRQAGAVAVIGLHHAKKDIRQKGMSLESVLRGTGDIAASCDAAYGLLRDQLLYNNGSGPNEIEVSCVKPRDFTPPEPFRIQASRRPIEEDGAVLGRTVSVIDKFHDFLIVNEATGQKAAADRLIELIARDRATTLTELKQKTGMSEWDIRQALKARGWIKSRGGRGGAGWTKAEPKPETTTGDTNASTAPKIDRRPRRPAVTLDLPGQQPEKSTVH